MTENERLEHDRLYKEACDLVSKEMHIHDRPPKAYPGLFVRFRLKKALKLFKRVLEINPENWPAMWMSGKACQRLGNSAEAFKWFVQAHQINPTQPDVAREASIAAMDLGMAGDAIAFANRAIQIEPHNYGLYSNLALTQLLAGHIEQAQVSIEQAVKGDPVDKISQSLKSLIHYFSTKGEKPPSTRLQLTAYWQRLRASSKIP